MEGRKSCGKLIELCILEFLAFATGPVQHSSTLQLVHAVHQEHWWWAQSLVFKGEESLGRHSGRFVGIGCEPNGPRTWLNIIWYDVWSCTVCCYHIQIRIKIFEWFLRQTYRPGNIILMYFEQLFFKKILGISVYDMLCLICYLFFVMICYPKASLQTAKAQNRHDRIQLMPKRKKDCQKPFETVPNLGQNP